MDYVSDDIFYGGFVALSVFVGNLETNEEVEEAKEVEEVKENPGPSGVLWFVASEQGLLKHFGGREGLARVE